MSTIVCATFWMKKFRYLSSGLQRNLRNGFHTNGVQNNDRNIVIIDGVRTPFMIAGTNYSRLDLSAVELGKRVLMELHSRIGIPKDAVEYLIAGNLITDVQANNMGRDIALVAGYPTIAAHSVKMVCVSSMQATIDCANLLKFGMYDSCVSLGTDFASDLQIRLARKLQSAILEHSRTKSFIRKMSIWAKLDFNSLLPEIPVPSEAYTGEHVIRVAERLAKLMQVSRKEQDEFAWKSHMLANQAFEKGYMSDIMPIKVLGQSEPFVRDNGIRKSSLEDYGKIKTVLRSPYATLTPGNCTFMTDGASACLLMTEERAKALGLKPKAYIRDYINSSQDPIMFPLSAPVFLIPELLKRNGLTLQSIDVWEMLEDFAAQMVANFKALDSNWYAQKFLNLPKKVGLPDMGKINAWGGSLSIGHPYAASGTRLIMHAVNRLIKEDGRFAFVISCALGGQGIGIFLERYPES